MNDVADSRMSQALKDRPSVDPHDGQKLPTINQASRRSGPVVVPSSRANGSSPPRQQQHGALATIPSVESNGSEDAGSGYGTGEEQAGYPDVDYRGAALDTEPPPFDENDVSVPRRRNADGTESPGLYRLKDLRPSQWAYVEEFTTAMREQVLAKKHAALRKRRASLGNGEHRKKKKRRSRMFRLSSMSGVYDEELDKEIFDVSVVRDRDGREMLVPTLSVLGCIDENAERDDGDDDGSEDDSDDDFDQTPISGMHAPPDALANRGRQASGNTQTALLTEPQPDPQLLEQEQEAPYSPSRRPMQPQHMQQQQQFPQSPQRRTSPQAEPLPAQSPQRRPMQPQELQQQQRQCQQMQQPPPQSPQRRPMPQQPQQQPPGQQQPTPPSDMQGDRRYDNQSQMNANARRPLAPSPADPRDTRPFNQLPQLSNQSPGRAPAGPALPPDYRASPGRYRASPSRVRPDGPQQPQPPAMQSPQAQQFRRSFDSGAAPPSGALEGSGNIQRSRNSSTYSSGGTRYTTDVNDFSRPLDLAALNPRVRICGCTGRPQPQPDIYHGRKLAKEDYRPTDFEELFGIDVLRQSRRVYSPGAQRNEPYDLEYVGLHSTEQGQNGVRKRAPKGQSIFAKR